MKIKKQLKETKKIFKQLLFISFILLFLLILSVSVKAFDSQYLMNYYSMDNTSSTSSVLYDSRINSNLNYNSNISNSYFIDGLKDTALRFYATSINNNKWFNGTTINLNDFSINFWVINTELTNTAIYILIGNSTCNLTYTGSNPTNPQYSNCYALRPYVFGVNFKLGTNTAILNGTLPNNNNIWNMITLTYNSTNNNLSYYINSYGGTSINVSLPEFTKFILGDGRNVGFDEVSIWNSVLNKNDLEILYNNGFGLSYNETIGITSSVYEQTFDYYDICISGTIFGINDLCHHLYFNSTSGVYCPYSELEKCSLGCIDNSSYWNNINSEPIDKNYTGKCGVNYIGNEFCGAVNDTRCINNSIVETCLLDGMGFKKWISTNICINGASCISGACYLPNETPQNKDGNIFNGLSLNQKYLIMLIVSILSLILFTLLGAMYGDGISGLMVGLVVSIIVSLTLSILMKLSLLIPILYILIGGAVLTVLIRRIFTG